MSKRFWLIAAALVILSLISAGIGNARTVTITPRDTEKTAEIQTIAPPQTTAVEAAAVSETVTYVLNINTKKFHRPDCESVSQMKEKNRRPFSGTREEAISAGFSPCQNCDP